MELYARLSTQLAHLQQLQGQRHVACRRLGEGAAFTSSQPQDHEFDRYSAEHERGAKMGFSKPALECAAVNYNVCTLYDITASSLQTQMNYVIRRLKHFYFTHFILIWLLHFKAMADFISPRQNLVKCEVNILSAISK